jgi:hypothetical protein
MAETKEYKPDLYNELLPVYSEMVKKSKIAKNIIYTSIAFGSVAFVVGAFSNTVNSFDINSVGEKNFGEGAVLGFGIVLIGGLISYCLYPDNDDINHFVNIHNRVTKSDKMGFSLGLNYDKNVAKVGLVKNF